jgi:PadR family transcriptional regulator PadR
MAGNNNNGERGQHWEAQLRKGCLEMAILSSLWSGRLYLARLKAEGLLQSEWVEAEAGHPRKYYWLTASGRRRAQQMAEAWNDFSASLEVLVQPVLRGDRR